MEIESGNQPPQLEGRAWGPQEQNAHSRDKKWQDQKLKASLGYSALSLRGGGEYSPVVECLPSMLSLLRVVGKRS